MEAVKDVSSLIYTKARGGAGCLLVVFAHLYAAPLGFSIGCRLYSELDDCDLCSGDITDKAILSAMPGDLYGGSAYGSIYFEVRVSIW